MIDTHAHVFKSKYEEVFEDIIQRLLEDLEFVVNVGYSIESSKEVKELNKKYPKLLPTVGIHPNESNNLTDNDLLEIEELISSEVVAVGEIGLDYFREGYNKENQHKSFKAQLEIARKHDLPVIIHTRSQDAIDETIEIIKDYTDLELLVHSWTGTVEQTKELMNNPNIWFSFNGISTFKNAPEIRELVKLVPINKMLLETDAPWLAPMPFRGKKNEPSYVKYVYEFIADLLREDLKEFEENIDANAREFYRIK